MQSDLSREKKKITFFRCTRLCKFHIKKVSTAASLQSWFAMQVSSLFLNWFMETMETMEQDGGRAKKCNWDQSTEWKGSKNIREWNFHFTGGLSGSAGLLHNLWKIHFFTAVALIVFMLSISMIIYWIHQLSAELLTSREHVKEFQFDETTRRAQRERQCEMRK